MHIKAATAARDIDRVDAMIGGIWVGPDQEVPTKPPYEDPVSAVLPRTDADPYHDNELLCLDLVQIATIDPPDSWAWFVLSDAGTYTYGHTIGLNRGECWRFLTWDYGEPRVYEASYGDRLPPEQIAKFYRLEADRARNDRAAVQLKLRRMS